MTYKIENFTRGAFKSSFNALIEKIKTTSYNDGRANNIDRFFSLVTTDRFFKPLTTALLDATIIQSDFKNLIEFCNKKNLLNQNPRQLSMIFLMTKTCLNISLSLFGNSVDYETKIVIEKIHTAMDIALPIISAIVAVASMNLMFIAGYFLQLGLVHLAENTVLGAEMRSICHYSSLVLCLASILHLNATSSNFFQKGIKLQLSSL